MNSLYIGGDENISFQYYNTESKQYLSTTMTPITLSEDENQIYFDYNNAIISPNISKDSIHFSLKSISFDWIKVKGHRN